MPSVGFYAGPSRWCSQFNDGMENTSRLLKFVESGGRIGLHVLELQKKTSLIGLEKIRDTFDSAGAAISSMRFLCSFKKLLTGEMFFLQEKKDSYIDVNRDGLTKDLVRAGEFVRARTVNSHPVKENDDYVRDPEGALVTRPWMDIVGDIILAVGRFFSCAYYFHKLDLYDLGKHSKWVGGVVLGSFASACTLYFIKSIKDLSEAKSGHLFQSSMEVLSSLLDLLAFPGDAGIGFTHPALSLAQAILSAGSAGVYLLKEFVYFNS